MDQKRINELFELYESGISIDQICVILNNDSSLILPMLIEFNKKIKYITLDLNEILLQKTKVRNYLVVEAYNITKKSMANSNNALERLDIFVNAAELYNIPPENRNEIYTMILSEIPPSLYP